MIINNGLEAEKIALNGWLGCTMPLDTKIGNSTKEEIIEKLKKKIEQFERFNK